MLARSIVGIVLKCSGAVRAEQSSPSLAFMGLPQFWAEVRKCPNPDLWLGSCDVGGFDQV